VNGTVSRQLDSSKFGEKNEKEEKKRHDFLINEPNHIFKFNQPKNLRVEVETLGQVSQA